MGVVLGTTALAVWFWCPQEASYCGFVCPTHHVTGLFSECSGDAATYFRERVAASQGPVLELTEADLAAMDDCDEVCGDREEIVYQRRSLALLRSRVSSAMRSITE